MSGGAPPWEQSVNLFLHTIDVTISLTKVVFSSTNQIGEPESCYGLQRHQIPPIPLRGVVNNLDLQEGHLLCPTRRFLRELHQFLQQAGSR